MKPFAVPFTPVPGPRLLGTRPQHLLAAIEAVTVQNDMSSAHVTFADDAGMGEASRYNAAVQVINPTPVYSAEGAQPGDNGDKLAAAVKRYRTGSVKEPAAVSTSGGSGSSGGGGGPQ